MIGIGGVGGALAAMATSLRNNSALVSKQKGLSRLREQLNHASAPARKLKFEDINPERVIRAREEIIKRFRAERKRNNLILCSIGIAMLLLLGSLSRFIIYYPAEKKEIDVLLLKQQMLAKEKRQNEKFDFYIEDGYEWLRKNNFHNSLFQFRLAVKQRPESYDAQLGLAIALNRQCNFVKIDCKKAKLQEVLLEEKFGDQIDFLTDISNYEDQFSDTN